MVMLIGSTPILLSLSLPIFLFCPFSFFFCFFFFFFFLCVQGRAFEKKR